MGPGIPRPKYPSRPDPEVGSRLVLTDPVPTNPGHHSSTDPLRPRPSVVFPLRPFTSLSLPPQTIYPFTPLSP
jgi:hypothetical protein